MKSYVAAVLPQDIVDRSTLFTKQVMCNPKNTLQTSPSTPTQTPTSNAMSDLALKALRVSESRYRRLFESARDGILLLNADTGQIEDVNPYLIEMLGYSHAEFLGKKLWEVGTFTDIDESQKMFSKIQTEGYVRYDDLPLRTKTGIIIAAEFVSNSYDCEGTKVIQCNIRNITERKKTDERIKELAFFDQLTGLPNRLLLQDRLKQAMVASSRSGIFCALLFMDVDNFKNLNDTLGHDMGDALLKQIGLRLTLCVREGDTVARLGGDEFVVVLAGLNTDKAEAAKGIKTVVRKMSVALNQPYQVGGVLYNSTASMGVTLFKGDLINTDDLMKQADLAMYKSKEAGRNTLRFFDPNMELAVMKRAGMENDLRRAIDEKQFVLHYQAQIVGENHITGAEVLLRWEHPQRGKVTPAEFIPLAEETGLILILGKWVLETACTRLVVWADQLGMADLTIAVNVSANQFRYPDFVDLVLNILKKTGANPRRLKLELTESLLIADVEDTIEKMFALKAKGICFSLDDFGTGYSSLSYLKRLPLDQLKIDQSFVRDILTDPNDAAIARTIVALGQSLGLGVIAEGVETEAQRNFLAVSGCHAYQGYFFSQPLPVEGFEKIAQGVF
ncbi:bifunctional diguanylate cyclase/phosphodiesterase [Nitrosomonas sp.]|uniref:putative bifunctional diguanylate cyclase/phosphodiesterase n=1 Tax=Nitrosomonas sp. TaxID=42353 RepID=UPI002731F5EF|nr:EAL domain-containing protein [Nitrosomonas sp.]MDP2224463.1 EAL domain-containing protein [Nitrosomonas sp.]